MIEGRRVIVSPHAVSRLRERHPSVITGEPVGHIFFEVQEAFRHGRIAKRIPRWAVRTNRHHNRGNRPVRYAWDESQLRCYVLVWMPAPDGRRSWIVVTTLATKREQVAA